METEIFTEEFKGFPVLAIWQVENGIKKGKSPIVSFGLRKAKTILANIEAIQEWVEEQEESKTKKTITSKSTSSNSGIELDNLNPIQMEGLKKFMQLIQQQNNNVKCD